MADTREEPRERPGPARPTAFYVVHGILVVVKIMLAIMLGAIGWRAWNATRRG
jgi:hypothetical protein